MTLTNMPEKMTELEAKRQAVDILKEEANQLAVLGLNREEYEKSRSRRERIAISREIHRLRLIAKSLES